MSDDRTRINRLEREVAELRGLLRHMPVRARSNPDITEVPAVAVNLAYDAAIDVGKVIGFFGAAPYSYEVASNATEYKSFGYVTRNADDADGMVVVTHGVVSGTFTAGHNYVTTSGDLSTSTSGLKYRYMVLSAIDATTGFFMQPCAVFNAADARLSDSTVDPETSPRGDWLRRESDDIIRPTSIYLNDLEDAAISTPSSGQLLRYNGSEWANATVSPTTYALNDLTDVSITAAASGELLRYDGSNWVDYSFGDLQHTIDAVGWPNGRVFVGTGSTTELGVSGSSKFVIGASARLDWVASGAESAGTARYATARVSGGNVVWQDGGTTVATWAINSTAASRYWQYAIDLGITEGKKIIIGQGEASYLSIYRSSGTLIFQDTGSSTYPISYSFSTSTITFQGIVDITSGTATVSGNAKLAGAASSLGFFGSSGSTKTSVSDMSALATTETADATYSSNEQDMLNNLKTDVTALRTKLNGLLDALQGYNLI